MVASAVGATSLIHHLRPDQVFLLGIAGLLNSHSATANDGNAFPMGDSPAIGDAAVATATMQHGIGIGEGSRYRSAESMGFLRFNSDLHQQTPDRIALQGPSINTNSNALQHVGPFLSVMSASSSFEDANQRRIAYPDALLEDMETYSVALACHASGVPLIAIRGISNVAGDRDFKNWNSEAAIKAASELLLEYL